MESHIKENVLAVTRLGRTVEESTGFFRVALGLYYLAGLMTEAAEAVTAYAFEVLAWPEIWVTNAASNHGSHRIKVKQGFERVEVVRGRFVFGEDEKEVWKLTREAWLARRAK